MPAFTLKSLEPLFMCDDQSEFQMYIYLSYYYYIQNRPALFF